MMRCLMFPASLSSIKPLASAAFLLLGLVACANQPVRTSQYLAVADQSHYAHLYSAVEEGSYSHDAFKWVDYAPLPKVAK
jgi:hypothetical protein